MQKSDMFPITVPIFNLTENVVKISAIFIFRETAITNT